MATIKVATEWKTIGIDNLKVYRCDGCSSLTYRPCYLVTQDDENKPLKCVLNGQPREWVPNE